MDLSQIFNVAQLANALALASLVTIELVHRMSQRFVVMAKSELIDRGRTADIDSEQRRAAPAF
jgi:branched-chain amino acid transport system ATP-binding protein